jgi:opacity protein-like surface antigen
MKIFITLVALFFCFSIANAQEMVGISFVQNFSTFRFVDSEKNVEDMSYTLKYGYGLSYQREIGQNIFVEGLLSYNNKGASSTLDQEQLDWSLHYVNIGSNIGYKFTFGRLSPIVGVGLYYGRILKADQYVGTVHYDMLTLNDIKKNDFGSNIFAGIEYDYSNTGAVFFRLNESMGLLQLEKNEDVKQKMFNRTFSIQLGLLFSIN